MGFMLTSCGGSTKDAIMKDVDNYFTEAEKELAEINNAEDFLAFVQVMSDKSDLINLLDEKYGDKTISDADNEAIQNYMYERATAYNKVEAAKAAEFLTPLIDHYEAAINTLYDNVGDVDEATFEAMFADLQEAEAELAPFAEYDNVLPELQQRAQAAAAKLDEMIGE